MFGSISSNWQAFWIWDGGDPMPRNGRRNFRRVFEAKQKPNACHLHIAADSRYRLWLNGEWLGDGPARSFPWKQSFDSYDLSDKICAGRNVIAVTVHHYGEGTFQYLQGRGGLICQLEINDQIFLVSDENWRVALDRAHETRAPRISCQMPFEEQFSAVHEETGWWQLDFDDGHWSPARRIGPAGCPPWTVLEPRAVPFLTREPVLPVKVFNARLVRPPALCETLNLRPLLFPGDRTANRLYYAALVCTEIISPVRQSVRMPRCFTLPEIGEYFLNGEEIPSPWVEESTIELKAGRNDYVVQLFGENHFTDFSLVIDGEAPLSICAPFDLNSKWLVVGPFNDAEPELTAFAQQVKKIDDLLPLWSHFQVSRPEHEIVTDVFNLTMCQREIGQAESILDSERLTSQNGEPVTISPQNGDIELLLDFGKELVGYTELDWDAPAGVILDANGFEAINNGKIQWTVGNRSSFRYITRNGRQHFVTNWRRGFRYLALTIRQLSAPLRIHRVRTLFATYPMANAGYFTCSDELLNRIWETGRHTLRCCMEDTFTDCPTYEQTFWVGDARVEALVNYAASGDWPLVARCVRLAAQSLSQVSCRNYLINSQVPSAWETMIPAWSFYWVLIAHEYWLFTGDEEVVKEVYPAVHTMLENCRRFCENEFGLFRLAAWNLFDWAPIDDKHQIVTHNNILLIAALKAAANLTEVLKKNDEAEQWRNFANRLATNVNQHLWDGHHQAYIDSIHDDGARSQTISQSTNALALVHGLVPPERFAAVSQVVLQPAERVVRFGSPFGLFVLLEWLSNQGQIAPLLEIMRQYWGMMLAAGATSFWETFPTWLTAATSADRVTPPKNAVPTRSHCHAWSASPTYLLSRCVLGISPAAPGYAIARIAPHPAELSWCHGAMPTPHGPIEASWRREAHRFSLAIRFPSTVHGEIILPVPPHHFPVLHADGRSIESDPRIISVELLQDHYRIHLAAGFAGELAAQASAT